MLYYFLRKRTGLYVLKEPSALKKTTCDSRRSNKMLNGIFVNGRTELRRDILFKYAVVSMCRCDGYQLLKPQNPMPN